MNITCNYYMRGRALHRILGDIKQRVGGMHASRMPVSLLICPATEWTANLRSRTHQTPVLGPKNLGFRSCRLITCELHSGMSNRAPARTFLFFFSPHSTDNNEN